MTGEFDDCLQKRKIRRFGQAKSLAAKELETANRDLADAKDSLGRERFKWATIQAYYSMFHTARALLYAKGYRERSHHCLIVALKEIYVEKRLLSNRFVEGLQRGKTLRENADYYDNWSEEASKVQFNSADDFYSAVLKLLDESAANSET